jgi:hypothetical protein
LFNEYEIKIPPIEEELARKIASRINKEWQKSVSTGQSDPFSARDRFASAVRVAPSDAQRAEAKKWYDISNRLTTPTPTVRPSPTPMPLGELYTAMQAGTLRYDLGPVDADEVVKAALDELALMVSEAGFEVELHCEDAVPLVLADPAARKTYDSALQPLRPEFQQKAYFRKSTKRLEIEDASEEDIRKVEMQGIKGFRGMELNVFDEDVVIISSVEPPNNFGLKYRQKYTDLDYLSRWIKDNK